MRPLSILICSSDAQAEQQMAKTLTEEGVNVQASNQLIGGLNGVQPDWDFILVDLDGLDTFLRSVLPVIRRRLPTLPAIGVWTKSANDVNRPIPGFSLELDAYLSEIPRPEDLIVSFPHVAAKYHNLQTECSI
jgi:hypothetical protein